MNVGKTLRNSGARIGKRMRNTTAYVEGRLGNAGRRVGRKMRNTHNYIAAKTGVGSLLAWLLLAAAAAAAIYFVARFLRRRRERFENGGGQGQLRVLFVGSKWCSHCKSFEPEWDAAVKQLPGADMRRLDADDDAAAVAALGVTAFPTVLFVAGGKQTEYTGPRTADALARAVRDYIV